MKKGKRWEVISNLKNQKSKIKNEDVVTLLLENRGIVSDEERQNFLSPKLEDITADAVGLDKKQLEKAIGRIFLARERGEDVVVFGDYDVDGITGTAILWESLYELGFKVMPYIPHRVEEGYGLSVKGIENLFNSNGILKRVQDDNKRVQDDNEKVGLIITVDNGVMAHEAIEYANSLRIDVIVTDHHA